MKSNAKRSLTILQITRPAETRPSPEVRFLLVFQALERVHRLSGFDQDRWDLGDYKKILAAVQNLSDLTPEQRDWVLPRLQHNEVSQRRRLTDIVKPLAHVYGGVVRPNLGQFIEIIVESRNALVHQLARPAESAISDARGLDILAAVLRIFLGPRPTTENPSRRWPPRARSQRITMAFR